MERHEYTVTSDDGLKLHVIEWGPAHAWPVVMLHGIRGYAETFANLARALAPTFRVIAFDQRGRGASDWDPARNYFTDAYVADLKAVVAQRGLEAFDVLGHSMGGIAAIVYAGTFPGKLRRLVIEDAGPGAFENSPGATRIKAELETTPTSFESWEAADAFFKKLRPTVTAEARADRIANMLKQDGLDRYTWRYDHAGIAFARLNTPAARSVDLWPYVAAISCPALVLRGGRSDYLQADTAQAMSERNPLISWRQIDDAGHYIHDDQPLRVANAVRAFLEQDLPAAASCSATRTQ